MGFGGRGGGDCGRWRNRVGRDGLGKDMLNVSFVFSSGGTLDLRLVWYLICVVRMLRFCSHGLGGLDG